MYAARDVPVRSNADFQGRGPGFLDRDDALLAAAARSAAAILFGNSMWLVVDGIEVSRSESFGLLGQFTGVKIEFKKVAHCWRLVKLGLDFRLGAPVNSIPPFG